MPIIRVIFFLHLFLLRHNIFLWYTNTDCTVGTNYTRNFFRVYKITIIIFRYKFQNIKNTRVRHTAFNNPPRIFHVGKYETSYNNNIYVLIILIQPSYVRMCNDMYLPAKKCYVLRGSIHTENIYVLMLRTLHNLNYFDYYVYNNILMCIVTTFHIVLSD